MEIFTTWIILKQFSFVRTPKHTWINATNAFSPFVILEKKSKGVFLCISSDPYKISAALSLTAFAWKQVKSTDEAPRLALLIRAGFSAHGAVGRSLTHTFSSHALLVLPWGEIEGDTLHRPRAPHPLWQQAFFFLLDLSGWLSWAGYLSPPQFRPSPPSLRIPVLTWQGLSRGLLPSGLICMPVHRQPMRLSGRAGL